MCGSLRECYHDREDNGSHGHDNDDDMTPLFVAASTVTRERCLKDLDDYYEMVSNAPILPGEVFNTYGENMGNAQLLAHYGFILDGNEHDTITWSLKELDDIVGDGSASERAHRVARLWQQNIEEWQELLKDSRLVYSHISQATGEAWTSGNADVFRLNEDGKISAQLWLYCALLGLDCVDAASRPTDGEELVKLFRDVLDLQTMLEEEAEKITTADDGGVAPTVSCWTEYFCPNQGQRRFSSSSPRGAAIGVIQAVLALCDTKIGRLGKQGADLENLGDAADVRAQLMVPCWSQTLAIRS
jgi:hypothetical protein